MRHKNVQKFRLTLEKHFKSQVKAKDALKEHTRIQISKCTHANRCVLVA